MTTMVMMRNVFARRAGSGVGGGAPPGACGISAGGGATGPACVGISDIVPPCAVTLAFAAHIFPGGARYLAGGSDSIGANWKEVAE